MTKNINYYSSFIFITNICVALYNNQIIYAFLFYLLTITSLLYHTNYTVDTYIIDKITCGLIVLYGGYTYYNKCITNKSNDIITNMSNNIITKIIILITFITVIYLYYFGYYNNKYCFDKNKKKSEKWHSLLHLISSIGHNLIIIL